MAFSSWICTNSTKNMLVKIVHPGGHVELHDRPVLAAEIILRNPRCCVAHPNVFQQPWAIVAPDVTLMPGQKFYVVPISSIRKLQRLSLNKCPPSLVQEIQTSQNRKGEGEDDDGMISTCWEFMNKNKHSDNEGKKPNRGSNGRKKDGPSWDDHNYCFMCLITGIKSKPNSDDSIADTTSSSSVGSSETKELTRKRTKDFTRKRIKGSPKRHTSFDNWQPNLESIGEE